MNTRIRSLAVFFLLLFYAGLSAQTRPDQFIIIHAETGLALDLASPCAIVPNNTTNGPSACEVVLSKKEEGKRSQIWKITELANAPGFFSIQNLLTQRIISVNGDQTEINRAFPTGTNYFKPVAAKEGNYVFVAGSYDDAAKDASGNPTLKVTLKVLQPAGNKIQLALFDEKQAARQTWKLVPVIEKTQETTKQQVNVKEVIAQANLFKQKNDPDAALQVLQKALALDPSSDQLTIEVSGVYWLKKDYPNCTKYAEKAVALNPANELAWNMLGLIARDQKQWEKAIPYFQKVIDINPKANITYANLAYCFANSGNNNSAVMYYTKSLETVIQLGLKPESYIYNNRGSAYRQLNQTDNALADFRKALEIDPNNASARSNLEILLKNQPQNGVSNAQSGSTRAAATKAPLVLYPELNKFVDINAYVTKNLGAIYGNKNITQNELNQLAEIGRHIDAYSDDPLIGPKFYGTVKRIQSNYYYIAGTIIAGAYGFDNNPVLIDSALHYYKKSIEVEKSYNHLAFPPDLNITRTVDVSVDPATGDYHTSTASEHHRYNEGYKKAYRGIAYIQQHRNQPDSALVNFLVSYLGDNGDGKSLNDYSMKELSDFLKELTIFANKAQLFNQTYIDLCVWILGKTAVKAYPDSKRDAEKAAIVAQVNHLVSLAVQSPRSIQYKADFPFPDVIHRWDDGLMIPAFYALDKAGKLSYQGYEAKRFVLASFYLLKNKQLDEDTRGMLELLLKDNLLGFSQNKFKTGDEFDKRRLTRYTYGELLWYQSLSEKYGFDEAAKALLDKRIKQCSSKFGKEGPMPFYYHETILEPAK